MPAGAGPERRQARCGPWALVEWPVLIGCNAASASVSDAFRFFSSSMPFAQHRRPGRSPASMTSAPQSRRSSTACCFMVDLLARKSHAWISAPSACHRTNAQVLGVNLNCSESGRALSLPDQGEHRHQINTAGARCTATFDQVYVRFGSGADEALRGYVRFAPESGQSSGHVGMSALCQSRLNAVQQISTGFSSILHVVG
jgi:hypothetical protein